MGKFEKVGIYKYKCICTICGREFFEPNCRKDIAKYCSMKCLYSKQRKNLEGKKFGRLLALEYEGTKNKNAFWKCVCDCGNIVSIPYTRLAYGRTKSCGCLAKEIRIAQAKERFSKHNKSNSQIYEIYTAIKERCYNKNNSSYKNYGGRGITMCDEWKNDFNSFYKWSMENGYSEEKLQSGRNKLSIDRIDVNGNYEPNNCRWVDTKTQANNKRTNRLLFYKGKYYTVKQVSELKNCSYGSIQYRIRKGWSVEEIFEIEVDNIYYNPRKNKKGRKKQKDKE
jgi:hypothetical protein